MNLKKMVYDMLDMQDMARLKNYEEQEFTIKVFDTLCINKSSQFYELYTKFFLRHLDSRNDAYEIIDPCPPQDMERATNFAHEYWNIPKNYILFSTGSSESGYLYNTEDERVYEFSLGQQHLLGTERIKHWNSFYEFMVWYLTTEED